MIYHYTSVNAFYSIIKSNKLRLMPSIHTNDPYDCYWPKIVLEHVCNDILKNSLSDLQRNKVLVLGHSFGASDAYSLKLIRDQLFDENIEWYIGVWKEEHKDFIEKYVKMVMYKMLLITKQTRYFLW